MRLRFAGIAVASAVLSVALSACVVAPAPVYGVVTYQAPPPVRYEVVGVAPYPGYIWIGGAWFWEGGAYVWRPGHWQAPYPGYRWVPHGWVRYGNAWRAVPGHWQRLR